LITLNYSLFRLRKNSRGLYRNFQSDATKKTGEKNWGPKGDRKTGEKNWGRNTYLPYFLKKAGDTHKENWGHR